VDDNGNSGSFFFELIIRWGIIASGRRHGRLNIADRMALEIADHSLDCVVMLAGSYGDTTVTPMAFISPNSAVIPRSLSPVNWVTLVILVACVEQVSAPVLRQGIRRMFGTLSTKKIRVTQFTSDNERGITALFGDMNGMGVTVVAVGPGLHDHTVQRMIHTLKRTVPPSRRDDAPSCDECREEATSIPIIIHSLRQCFSF
jgi:hypothetical protein